MERLIVDLAERQPGRSYCFTMDNLNVHRNPMVVNLIVASGHRYVLRAPYWAVDGAIEYLFNTIHAYLLMRYNELHNLDDLDNEINLIVGRFENFRKYFLHVGFE